jgi:hypothetical protein
MKQNWQSSKSIGSLIYLTSRRINLHSEILSEQDLKDSNTHVVNIALYKIEKPFQHIHTVI